jgi:uncharacterized protein YceH (UPF0502 family)
MDYEITEQAEAQEPKWRPLTAAQRRVVGVLVEKAKTTPDAYPMTVNALTSGCNQKSNRCPQMQLTPEVVEEALDELREMGAVAEVQGAGRVPKYRHYLYEWLAVEKVELAVMAELLLRGEQTVGELRGRAARMEPVTDLNALRPVLQSLIEKGLVAPLTPEGRGQVVTHGLYEEHEMNELRARFDPQRAAAPLSQRGADTLAAAPPAPPQPPGAMSEALADLRREVAQVQADIEQLRERLHQLEAKLP